MHLDFKLTFFFREANLSSQCVVWVPVSQKSHVSRKFFCSHISHSTGSNSVFPEVKNRSRVLFRKISWVLCYASWRSISIGEVVYEKKNTGMTKVDSQIHGWLAVASPMRFICFQMKICPLDHQNVNNYHFNQPNPILALHLLRYIY